MFQYQEKVNKGVPQLCTREIWDQLLDSPEVKNICERIAELDTTATDYAERKQALKKRLPIIIPHAASFRNGKRISTDAIPSGLAMLDVDHVDNPREWWNNIISSFSAKSASPLSDELVASSLRRHGIVLVAINASGKGLRIIGERQEREPIEAAQLRFAQALGIEEFDTVTKDLARASYVVPRSYVLWIYEAGLFSEGDRPDLREIIVPLVGKELPALPPYEPVTGNLSPVTDLTYRGIPYSEIVQQLLIATGNCGGAEQGERNTVYFSLANYMRYICDFNADLLFQVLPDFGLSEQERRQVIASAIGRPRKSYMPNIMEGAIAVCEREIEASSQPYQKGKGVKAADMTMPALPKLLDILCGRLPADYRPAMVIASLPVLGTLATGIRFEYLDMQEQSLSFFSCITAPAASGKSFIRKPVDLLLTPINEQDAIEREKEQAYKERLRASKNSKNQPEDPHACPRNNGISISIAKLLQLLTYAEGKHLIGIGEEMDTLVKSERAGVWSQKSDIYRLAFDNAEYGQAYMSDASFNAHIKVYYNLLLTGTPNSLKRFFKDLENGLATRVCFAQLPDTSFTEIPVFAPYTDAEKEEVIRWARRLNAEKGTIVCPEVGKVIADWLEKKRQQAIDADSHAMDILRRRSAVMGFRAGMLCYLLEDHKYTDIVGQFAEWVAEYVFRNQMELWGDQMEQELTGALEVISIEEKKCLELPVGFSSGRIYRS